jgi:HPt (histidine-containing phosphotransfer) domain-containing protein
MAALDSEPQKSDIASDLIKMVYKPDMMVSKDKYQDFLQSFIEYSERFRQEMFSGLLNNNGSDKNTTGSILSQA